jgi:adenine-specific DNA-methyltransferase
MVRNRKLNGIVYTPDHIVKSILNLIEYKEGILCKHVIDNSCGDGAFLIEVVRRYCNDFFNSQSDKDLLKSQLEEYIHGIDNNEKAVDQCKENLNLLMQEYSIQNINWDIFVANTLEVTKYDNKMDFVVGNPPYIRVHNLNETYEKVKQYNFANNGMTDLYLVFFEIGFKMINSTGKMGLITPSSFLRSKAGTNLRKYIYKRKNLEKVVDLEHFQAFDATTYTMITIFNNEATFNSIEYFTYDELSLKPKKIDDLNVNDIYINQKMYFSDKKYLEKLKHIQVNFKNRVKRKIVVKNGFATLADKIFIGDFDFQNGIIDVIKASKGEWHKCIYPYDEKGNLLEIEQLKKYRNVYKYLLKNKEKLLSRSISSNQPWYSFGRSQAINDVKKNKIAINQIIKNKESIKINYVEAGKGVYSGLYIISDYEFDEIENIIRSDEFIAYLKLLKNYKSGGYYSLSSKELEKYLYINLEKGKYGQLELFANN